MIADTAPVIRAAWSILTARYTDTEDVVFGAMVTGRQAPIPGIDRMIAPSHQRGASASEI